MSSDVYHPREVKKMTDNVAGEEQDCARCQSVADLRRKGENSLSGILGGARVNPAISSSI